MATVVNGIAIPQLPWQEKPLGAAAAVWRYAGNPIIARNATPCCARVFNSAVLPYEGAFIGVFRADHTTGTPGLHVGHSPDGLHWTIDDEEIQWQDEAGQPYQPAYAYDPRLVCLDGVYSIVWCTDFSGPALAIGQTTDFRRFIRLPNATTPFNRNGVLFPRRINGRYVMLNRPSDNGHTPFGDMYLSESPDLRFWGLHRKVMSTSSDCWWQQMKIGPGTTPIETDEGWLIFFHGVVNTCNGYVYSFGAALLDRDEPSKVLYRNAHYLLTPEEPYETTGFVPNVCFPCAALCDAPTGRIAIYYGAADTYVALAFTTVDEVIARLKEDSRLAANDGCLDR